jgi:hypothetical protein
MAAAPVLSVDGIRFALDGNATFLIFVSYFDGLRRPAATRTDDFRWLRAHGVHGVRVWPNWSMPRLMEADGGLNDAVMASLVSFVDEAARAGLVVDVTFNREPVCGSDRSCELTAAEYRDAIAAAARALASRANVLFDLQNEWNTYGGLSLDDLRTTAAALRKANPSALVTASTDSNYAEALAASHAFDVLAYHNPRDAAGRWADGTDELVERLRTQLIAHGRELPIHLQEPNRFPASSDTFRGFDREPAHYVRALENAARAGAAAWTFHTASSFELNSATPFVDLLQPGERAVMDALTQQPPATPHH